MDSHGIPSNFTSHTSLIRQLQLGLNNCWKLPSNLCVSHGICGKQLVCFLAVLIALLQVFRTPTTWGIGKKGINKEKSYEIIWASKNALPPSNNGKRRIIGCYRDCGAKNVIALVYNLLGWEHQNIPNHPNLSIRTVSHGNTSNTCMVFRFCWTLGLLMHIDKLEEWHAAHLQPESHGCWVLDQLIHLTFQTSYLVSGLAQFLHGHF